MDNAKSVCFLLQQWNEGRLKMLLTVNTKLTIHASAEAVWTFASNPTNWTASNPAEHFGLQYDSADNRPATGVTFRQKESVAGIRAVLRGHFLHVAPPSLAVWHGVATYPVLAGILRIRIPEGGVIQARSIPEGTELSHDVYMDFPDTLFGKFIFWIFKRWKDGEAAVYSHTFRELQWFKEQLEAQSTRKMVLPLTG